METKYVALIDQIGRTIIGVQVGDTETTVTLRNPVIIHVQPQQNGLLAVQTFPLFFFEFIDKENRKTNDWTYNKSAVTLSNVVLNPDVVKQYETLNTPPVPVQANPKVVSINDIID